MDIYCTPLLHPSAIVRGRWEQEPVQEAHLRRLRQAGPTPQLVDVERPPPGANLLPTPHDLTTALATARRLGYASVDVETPGIGSADLMCVGVAPFNLETGELGGSVCVHFRKRGGQPFHSRWQDHLANVRFLYDLLADESVVKLFHNAPFDLAVLAEHRFTVRGRVIDTMVMAHAAYAELPLSLQFLSTLLLGFPRWKGIVEEDEEEESKG